MEIRWSGFRDMSARSLHCTCRDMMYEIDDSYSMRDAGQPLTPAVKKNKKSVDPLMTAQCGHWTCYKRCIRQNSGVRRSGATVTNRMRG